MAFLANLVAAVIPQDVIVHAATPGGVMAAVAASREGAQVTLLEPSLYVGAMASSGLGYADFGLHAESVLGGQCQEFYRRVAKHYNVTFKWPKQDSCGDRSPPWSCEPHVAEGVFNDMLAEANVTVMFEARIVSVQWESDQKRISSVTCADGRVFASRVFVDGSYEGALMKLADVSYTFGREANTTYDETSAGRLPTYAEVPVWPFGDRTAQIPRQISPWVDATNTTLIPGVWGGEVAPVGGADKRVGAYDWRLTLTDVPSNMVPIPKPEKYDPGEFELVRRAMKRGYKLGVPGANGIPNQKTDWKMFGVFGEHPNAQWKYPNGTWEEQQSVVAEFKRYALSLIHFFRVDDSVPEATRKKMQALGLCRDEYNRSSHWMPQLYVRSALRMVSQRVLTQADVVRSAWQGDAEGIGVGAYTVDIPGPVQIIVDPVTGEVVAEGALKVSPRPDPHFCDPAAAPFPLPYSIMVPKLGEAENLLVPVAVSASHIGFNAVRLEPTWMILGQSAGVAAAMVVGKGRHARGRSRATDPPTTVQGVNVTELRARLRELGQYIEPLPAPPMPPTLPTPAPSPTPHLTGREWYAWKPMWELEAKNASIKANGDKAVLKREYTNSGHLPPSEVHFFNANATVALRAGPGAVMQASDPEYWVVTVATNLTA